MVENINEAVDFIKSKTDFKPRYGLILGTGLGGLAREIEVEYELKYKDIPFFPVSTVESHQGKLLFGRIGNKNVVAMVGRFHLYEGYSMVQITFPVRVMKFLGIEKLLVSNAAGGLADDMEIGDIMIINDHINLQLANPLIGPNIDELGLRFPDLSEVYDTELIDKAVKIAADKNIRASTGVYVSVTGPCLETRAEYKFIRIIGGDAVGMSTVPEVLVANHMGLKSFAVSIITDIGYPTEKVKKVFIEDVIAAANKAEPKLTMLVRELLLSME
ncbi:MAG: purine-nucleoside phosphorylase [Bacteroidetes bacterium]|nr:purine-nucleoside phosphorylase [Bacteroidota bacterium]